MKKEPLQSYTALFGATTHINATLLRELFAEDYKK